MEQAFWKHLLDCLERGESVQLLTILSGQVNGRDLTGQKLLLRFGEELPSDPSLMPFWKGLPPMAGPFPTLWEGNGVRLFCEQLSAQPRLVICGGGHISLPLAQMGSLLGFDVTVLMTGRNSPIPSASPRPRCSVHPFARRWSKCPTTGPLTL